MVPQKKIFPYSMKVDGKSLMIRVGGRTVALSTNCSFDASWNTMDARTKDDEGADDVLDYITWSIGCDSLLGINPGTDQHTYDTLIRKLVEAPYVDVEVMLAAGAAERLTGSDWAPGPSSTKGFAPVGGRAIIKSISVNGGVSDKAGIKVQLAGQGALSIIEYPTISYIDGTTLVIDGPVELGNGVINVDTGEVTSNTLEL